VQLAAGPLFAPEGGLERFIRLPYTQSPDVLSEAVTRLAAAWNEDLAKPGQRGAKRRETALVT
jgi:bifunctional pyridoxal-dependent enzyme with beta-cystathionase and maltose regulon repressor activities